MNLLPDGALVVWKWEAESDNENVEDETEDIDEQEEKIIDRPEHHCTHTVTFKCIGSTKEDRYQDTLRYVSRLKPVQQVEVKLVAEPNNPFDSKAIAFVAVVDHKDCRIGYAVREVLDDLHSAIREKIFLKWSLHGLK